MNRFDRERWYTMGKEALSRVEELLARKVPEEKEAESPVPKVWYTT